MRFVLGASICLTTLAWPGHARLPATGSLAQLSITTLNMKASETCVASSQCVAPGAFSIVTEPWTEVLIDGAPRGSTPLVSERVLPGLHEVRFLNRARGIDSTRRLNVAEAKLLKVKAQFGPASRTTSNSRTVAHRGPAFDCGMDLVSPGFLSVAGEPWAEVFVDGELVGSTPLYRLPVAPGARRVTLVFRDRDQTEERDVMVVPEREERISWHRGPALRISSH